MPSGSLGTSSSLSSISPFSPPFSSLFVVSFRKRALSFSLTHTDGVLSYLNSTWSPTSRDFSVGFQLLSDSNATITSHSSMLTALPIDLKVTSIGLFNSLSPVPCVLFSWQFSSFWYDWNCSLLLTIGCLFITSTSSTTTGNNGHFLILNQSGEIFFIPSEHRLAF